LLPWVGLPMQAPMQALLEFLPAGHADEALARALNPERLPAHIAIIMDGNGRWARRRGQLRVAGHKAGMRPVRTVIETCSQMASGRSPSTHFRSRTGSGRAPKSKCYGACCALTCGSNCRR